ncbi:MAG: glycosyltransferase [Gemmatimonadota bacterium]
MKPGIIHVASGREWRGGQNQVRLLANALARQGEFEQVVVTGRGTELARRLKNSGIPVLETGWTISLDPRVLLGVLQQLRGGPTLLHAHDSHALTIAVVASRLKGTPLVATRRVDFHLRRPGSWLQTDRVIAISEAVRSILLVDGIPEERITVVHSGINPEEVRSAPLCDIRKMLGLAPNMPLVVNVAALVPHKDHLTLLNAAAALNQRQLEAHWVVAGDGPMKNQLINRSRELGVENRVHFIGQTQHPLGVIREASVFVMSSREEGLGTSVLDAMALDIPVAATRAGGIPEMLSDGAGFLVDTGDGDGLARAVERLLTDPELRNQTRAAAGRHLAGFTDIAMADGVRSVYRSLLPTG